MFVSQILTCVPLTMDVVNIFVPEEKTLSCVRAGKDILSTMMAWGVQVLSSEQFQMCGNMRVVIA